MHIFYVCILPIHPIVYGPTSYKVVEGNIGLVTFINLSVKFRIDALLTDLGILVSAIDIALVNHF